MTTFFISIHSAKCINFTKVLKIEKLLPHFQQSRLLKLSTETRSDANIYQFPWSLYELEQSVTKVKNYIIFILHIFSILNNLYVVRGEGSVKLPHLLLWKRKHFNHPWMADNLLVIIYWQNLTRRISPFHFYDFLTWYKVEAMYGCGNFRKGCIPYSTKHLYTKRSTHKGFRCT